MHVRLLYSVWRFLISIHLFECIIKKIYLKNFRLRWHFCYSWNDVVSKNINSGSSYVTRFIPNSLAAESRFVTFTHFLGNPRCKVSTVFSSGLEAVVVAFTRSRCCRVSHLHNAQIRACKYVIQTKQVSPRAVLLLILLCWRQRSVKKLKAMLSYILKAEINCDVIILL